ncbi:MAG: hypothetical protein LBB66_04345 [Desulfovibrio sp.]|nr:hypothetical protein [Desulfovibrio sp.]
MEKFFQFILGQPFSKSILMIIFGVALMLAPYSVVAPGVTPPPDVVGPIVDVGRVAFFVGILMACIKVLQIAFCSQITNKERAETDQQKR